MPNTPATLFVCTTCPHAGEDIATPLPAGSGKTLLAAIKDGLAASPTLATQVTLQEVKCMGGCQTPCSVAMAGPGRENLLFGRMDASQVDAILACLQTYVDAAPGHRMAWAERPEPLRDTLMVRIPAA